LIRLIVNSDDYGRTAEVSRGIRQAHQKGIVTSTTCLMNLPTTADDIKIALRETPKLGLGVHLVLTAGRPLLPPDEIGTLVAPDGEFHKLLPFTDGIYRIDPTEAKTEWRAQIEAFVAAAGRKPTHLDSHHHCSYFTEGLLRAMLELAQKYGCAIRNPIGHTEGGGMSGFPPELHESILEFWPRLRSDSKVHTTDIFFTNFYDAGATQAELLRIFQLLEEGTGEIMCHPGFTDPELLETSGYARPRERELGILTSRETRQAILDNGIKLISFADL
jgi:predicted glycoside hydrolase/deacetylase ChbG (UPF0249 family)